MPKSWWLPKTGLKPTAVLRFLRDDSSPEYGLLFRFPQESPAILLVYLGDMLGENWTLLLAYKIEIAVISFIAAGIIAAIFYFYQKQRS